MRDRRAARVERVGRRVVGPDLILSARDLPGSVTADEVDPLVERVVRGGHEAADVGHVRARRPRVRLDVIDACDRIVHPGAAFLPAEDVDPVRGRVVDRGRHERRSRHRRQGRPRVRRVVEPEERVERLVDAERVAACDVCELAVGGGRTAVEVDRQRRADLPAAGRRRRRRWRRRRRIGRGPDRHAPVARRNPGRFEPSSSTTKSRHVPLGSVPLKTESSLPPLGVGAGAGKLSWGR